MVEAKGPSRVWQIMLDLNSHQTFNYRLSVNISFLLLLYLPIVLNKCPKEHFIITGLDKCHPWLNCSEIRNIKIMNNIGFGTIKNVFKSNWRGYIVAVSILKYDIYLNDFNFGLNMLKLLQPNRFVVQLIGFCEELNILVTEYHSFNNAINLKYLINDSISALKSCLNYVEILNELHNNNNLGKLVNCDSNSLYKLLSQFLITNELNIVLSDLDSVEIVKNSSVICGSNDLTLNNNINNLLIPPEQINYGKFNDKSEIWKVPDVCQFFIDSSKNNILKYLLFDVHKLCKNNIADRRPSAKWLVNRYKLYLNDPLLQL